MGVRALHRRAVEATGKLVDGLTDAQLDLPTPCSKWTVREVVGHMVDNHTRLIAALGGTAPETADDVRVGYRRATDATQAAFADGAALSATYELAGKSRTGGEVLGIMFGDVLVHGWDLGRSIGVEVRFEEELAEQMVQTLEAFPNTPDVWGPDAAFAGRLPVAEGSSAHDRLLAITGRQADWAPAGTN
ncbi:TIGR03086 family metal-binding protein [Actinokineospora enzanensis]|uniref:TIGR03086 family metal-binding protein n=1 Tax=Actinokineospora enzanensis TaxID=155975 RepID=UPI00036364E0|nr:TIGR03086 family metal-binding protein [Actinokineospora enzanensis]